MSLSPTNPTKPLPDRRGFLRQLGTLPLIGGAVEILGAPTACATPVTLDLLETYKSFLDTEARFLAWEMAGMPAVRALYSAPPESDVAFGRMIRGHIVDNHGTNHHAVAGERPSFRAAAVLSAVGCPWRGGSRSPIGSVPLDGGVL